MSSEDSPHPKKPPEKTASGPEKSEAPLVTLSDKARRAIGGVVVLLAVAHVIWPNLAIDAVFLGLLAFAVLVLLFDIDAVEWLGISAKRRRAREQAAIAAAEDRVQQIEVPTAPSKVLVAPQPSSESVESSDGSLVEEEVAHRDPFDLVPPIDPLERLLWASEQIRLELIVIAGSSGHLPSGRGFDQYSAVQLATRLAEKGVIPSDLLLPIRTVVRNRNAVAHGHPLGPAVVEAASDLAIDVLIKLREVPRTFVRIESFPVDLFRDQSLSARHPAVGVMISQLDLDGRELNRAVYPTAHAYKRGRFVSWEWSLETVYKEEAWYFDAKAKTARLAFSSSALFVGREFPEQWGLKYHMKTFQLDM